MLTSRLLPFRNILPPKKAFHFTRRALLSTLNAPKVYASFFKKYNCGGYTFEPGKPPEQEFQLLAKNRQWGTKSTTKHHGLLDRAIRLAEFFERFEDRAGRYTYSPGTEHNIEFKRLCTVKGWDKGKIVDVKKEYEKLREASNHSRDGGASNREDHQEKNKDLKGRTAIARFFIKYQCPGYSYEYRSSGTEFRALAEAKKAIWKSQTGTRKRTGPYEKTEEYERLQREFQVAIEECFDSFLRVKSGSLEEKETRPWETLVELLKLGKAPMDGSTAAELIKTVHINIYDFVDLFTIHLPPSAKTLEKLLTTEFYQIQKLRFPNVVILAAYSCLTKRVYDLENAKKNGTLVLLLHRLREHFHEFDDFMKTIYHRNLGGRVPSPNIAKKMLQGGFPREWESVPSPDIVKKMLRGRFPREWERLDKELRERFPFEWGKDNGG
ncbi:hypothetical protein L873DRAFT_1695070 [Choiromyces venosus 120613-1]|uniref:Uncharacterized protein n=1 Tax=Choiromyces venosus 120613-1 TaxID=1336337 RepID=A0A3N4JIK4_9PEZI|nr:hypothetical protein L873DRAFT_1695070 [Choiromyces venosus 120613-1]